MLFYTWPFLIFMLIVLPGFFVLRRTPYWIPWLLAASYFFYGWWNPYYLLLVVYATALDYLLVTLMDHCPKRADGDATPLRRDPVLRIAFLTSATLAGSLAIGAIAAPASTRLRPTFIAFAILVLLMAIGARVASRKLWLFISLLNFKYAGFVEENLNLVLSSARVAFRFPAPATLMPHGWQYVLPVGISFFTFQSMSYTIDFYLGKVQRERNFLRFATFVCFFPQLMAGPIERARQMLPQFQEPPPFEMENLTDGMSLFLVGLFKKLALANYLAVYVDRVYENPARASATSLALATFAFSWQIFFDFSGYTDMARGVARMMGFHLVLNFNNPYLATGLGDFWSRWHISLSTWFRDYVYIPLGGNRHGSLVTYRNLFITFVVSGIWHGADWKFAIWGALHAIGVILTRGLERSAFYRDRVPAGVKRAWVFAYVCFAWIFFRASSLGDSLLIVRRLFSAAWNSVQMPALMIALVLSVWIYQMLYESRWREALRFSPVRVAMAASMILYMVFFSSFCLVFFYFVF
jgi:D-alanyl-lipoteichoic acid acyltransferase DltB (MBOAT superfamily)